MEWPVLSEDKINLPLVLVKLLNNLISQSLLATVSWEEAGERATYLRRKAIQIWPYKVSKWSVFIFINKVVPPASNKTSSTRRRAWCPLKTHPNEKNNNPNPNPNMMKIGWSGLTICSNCLLITTNSQLVKALRILNRLKWISYKI